MDTPSQSFEVIVVGAGFNGLYQLKRLREAGWSVRLVEAGSGLGGVWHNNRYPGARVDCHVPNYEYSMPEVWEGWNWTERFPGREELVAYFDHVDSVWNLSSDIDLNTRISSAHFDDDAHRWRLGTDDGRGYDCQWLLMCTGFGSAPYVPDLPGLEAFAGVKHHTAQWPLDGLSLDGKRVGIIGTGASGVQVAQEAAAVAGHLTLFQRNPVYALPMEQRTLTADEQTEAKRDYPETFRLRNAPPGSFHDMERVNLSALDVSEAERMEVFEDRWAKGGFHFWVGAFKDTLSDLESNRLSYDFWRDKTRSRIKDESLHESLAPTDPPYPFGTKRPSLEQNFYDIFDQDNVSLVDLKRHPLVEITETGVKTEAGHVELDVLVLATGFDANTGGFTRLDFRGAGGISVGEAWAHGVDTHIGIASPGFPNMLMLYGPQSAGAFCNGPVCAELQGEWIFELLDHLRSNELTRFDTDTKHAEEWSDELAGWAEKTLFGKADSWYMGANIPGKRRQLLNIPNSDAYLKALADCAKAGYEGFVFE
ncbi:MAG: flavin-containing monooxygenase [Acidimicrobiales bacterium]